MFSGHKTFITFDGPKQSSRFVRVNGVLDVFAVRKQFKIIQTIVRAVQVFMVNFHSIGNRPDKRFPHGAVNGNFRVFSVFARAEPNIMIARNMRFDRPSVAIASPCLTVFNVERGGDAGFKKASHRTQRGAIRKHGFSSVNLLGGKQLSSRYTSNARKIADFVKAFIAADWFPNLHTVDIKPVYVGGQA